MLFSNSLLNVSLMSACASDSCVVCLLLSNCKTKVQTTASHLNFNLHNKHFSGLRKERDKEVKGT